MATTTVAHASLIRYDNDGNQLVINLKNTGDDVSISRSSNGNLPSGATTAQGLANSLGALAFRSSLGKGDVGLGNVDNTADSAKSVKYATSAGSANAVAWGNITGKPSTYPPSAHTHTKSQISDFPSSLPASDVYAWAKAKSKPSYSKSEIGLGNVDNTADSAKSVKYATSAGSANSVAWGSVTGKPSTFTPSSHTHSQYLEKTSYEYSKELACGGSDSLILLGTFPCYDSNVTMTISCTATTSYYGVLIMATQNISTSADGVLNLKLYGDDENILTPKISVSYVKGSNAISIYMKGDGWSKYLVHIQANALAGAPSGICTHVKEIPSTANRYPVNVSRSISDNDLVVSKTAPSRTCLWAKID